jgi:hypothetical protein
VPTLNLESATNSSESMKLGELLNVTSFTEAPRDNSYTNHRTFPRCHRWSFPRDPKPSSASSRLGGFSLGAPFARGDLADEPRPAALPTSGTLMLQTLALLRRLLILRGAPRLGSKQ